MDEHASAYGLARPGHAPIDRQKLRAQLRELDRGALLVLLERALDRISDTSTFEVVRDYLRPAQLPSATPAPPLLDEVLAWSKAALAGAYYEDYLVTSSNFDLHSNSVDHFIADFDRLLARVLSSVETESAADVREMIELMIAPLRRLDEGMDDVLFFGDEGGSWQIGVNWDEVFSIYFRVLAETATPDEFAYEVHRIIDDFEHSDRPKHLERARGCGNTVQRAALDASPRRRRR
jgi:hypothetical protein